MAHRQLHCTRFAVTLRNGKKDCAAAFESGRNIARVALTGGPLKRMCDRDHATDDAMQLTMTVLRCPDAVAPETRNVTGGEFSVGRGPGVDWVLPDPERLLSKRHFAVAFRGGSWQLADTSTNGTFLNRENDPIGAGDLRRLRDGDRVRVGAYEIEMRLVDEEIARAGPASRGGRPSVRRSVLDGPVRAGRAAAQSRSTSRTIRA